MRKGEVLSLQPKNGVLRYTIQIETARDAAVDLFVFTLNEENKVFNIFNQHSTKYSRIQLILL